MEKLAFLCQNCDKDRNKNSIKMSLYIFTCLIDVLEIKQGSENLMVKNLNLYFKMVI